MPGEINWAWRITIEFVENKIQSTEKNELVETKLSNGKHYCVLRNNIELQETTSNLKDKTKFRIQNRIENIKIKLSLGEQKPRLERQN